MDIQIFVQNVKHLLDERGISYSRAGRESGAGEDFIRNIDRKNSFPSIDKVKKMADYLEVTVSELLGEEKPTSEGGDGQVDPLRSTLLHNFDQLNQEGRERLVETSDDMVSSGKYIKSDPAGLGQKQA